MGCGAIDTAEIGSSEMLKTQLKKIKLSLDLRKQKIGKEQSKADQNLYIEVIKPAKERSRQLQRAMIISNARLSNQKNICILLENETNIILQHAHFIDDQNQLVNLRSQVNNIRFCSSFMDSKELMTFEDMIKSLYPIFAIPSESEITNQLLKSQSKQQVAFNDELEYIFQFSARYSVTMQKINEIGHTYKYGAQKYA